MNSLYRENLKRFMNWYLMEVVALHEALSSQDGLEVSEEPLPKSINRNQE